MSVSVIAGETASRSKATLNDFIFCFCESENRINSLESIGFKLGTDKYPQEVKKRPHWDIIEERHYASKGDDI